MQRLSILFCIAIICGFAFQAQLHAATTQPTTQSTSKPHNFARWEKEIEGIEKRDAANPPHKHAMLFIGSSFIRIWKTLPQDFPEHPVINHGFGGSEVIDSTHFANRLIFPYDPAMVFIFGGSNDIHAGMKADEVAKDYEDFYRTVHAKLPNTMIAFISLRPCPSRWAERDEDKKYDDLVKQFIADNPDHQAYIDTWDVSLDANGNARRDLFQKDMLHLNAEGYKLLTQRVREQMPKWDDATSAQ
jgi:lysophospholipase L1-like esterase